MQHPVRKHALHFRQKPQVVDSELIFEVFFQSRDAVASDLSHILVPELDTLVPKVRYFSTTLRYSRDIKAL